jgi:Flp pilus assembly protein TadG
MRPMRGQALLVLVLALPVLLAVLGLVVDGGIVFDSRRELQNVADGAARVGAMQVDIDAYRRSDGQKVVLSESAAEEAAREYLARESAEVRTLVEAELEFVIVRVQRDVSLAFLSLAGFDTVEIEAVATAHIRYGVDQDRS